MPGSGVRPTKEWRAHHAEGGVVVRAAPAAIASAFADPAAHAIWGVQVTPYEDRGPEGMRCLVRGPLVGSMEWWLEPLPRQSLGVHAHLWLRVLATADGDRRPLRPGWLADRQTRLRTEGVLRRWRGWANALKDAQQPGPHPSGRASLSARHRAAPRRRPPTEGRPVADQTEASIEIEAGAEEIMAVISDFDSYPEWVDSLKVAEVLTWDGDMPHTVRMVLDHPLVKDDYTLEYSWPDELTSRWHLIEGSLLRTMDGSYELEPLGDDTTTVTYALSVDISLPMPALLRRKAEKTIIDGALKGLRRRVVG